MRQSLRPDSLVEAMPLGCRPSEAMLHLPVVRHAQARRQLAQPMRALIDDKAAAWRNVLVLSPIHGCFTA